MDARVLGGRYQVEEMLGSGGMAQVYKGVDSVLGRTVAIKILDAQFARDQGFVARFRREAQAAAKLSHPNVVGVFDTGSDDGTHYIVMEYVEGRTLADFVASGGKLLPQRAIELAEAVSRALAFSHQNGIVHRDVKPGNIMVTREGEVKVMDFGIARAVTSTDTVTQTATVLGTASYLSPEQAQGQPVDARSDLYSLGIVLYEMLVGRVPFTGDSAVAVAYKHVQETPEVPSRLNPEVPPELDAVVMKALAKNPANRYQSADEFRGDLERARQGQPVAATPILPAEAATRVMSRPTSGTAVLPPTAAGPPRRSYRWVWWVLLILLLLGALGAGLYYLANAVLQDDAGPGTVAVPSVIGFTETQARSELQNADLELGGQTFERTDEADPGTVISQEPEPQAQVPPGTEVDVVIARPLRIVVPDVVGLEEDAAKDAIEAEGLSVRVEKEPSATVAEGLVVSQDPAGETEVVDPDTEVTIVVSEGPEDVQVPDVFCFSRGKASSEITRAGLVLVEGTDVPTTAECPNPNKVQMQDPAAGATVEPGSEVTVSFGTPGP